MKARVVSEENNSITIQVTKGLNRSMLDSEVAILEGRNEAGCLATGELL